MVVGDNETHHYCAVFHARAQEVGGCVAEEGGTLQKLGLLLPNLTHDFGAKECLQQCIKSKRKNGLQ